MISYIITVFSEVSILLPFLFAVFTGNWKGNKILTYFFVYIFVITIRLCITLPNDITFFLTHKSSNNLFFYNWVNIITNFVALLIYTNLLEKKAVKNINYAFIFIHAVVCFLELKDNSITYLYTAHFNTYTYIVGDVMIVFLGLCYFYQLLQNPVIENITTNSYFLLNVGFILFYSGNMFLNVFILIASKNEGELAWLINGFVSVVLNILATLVFYYHQSVKNHR